MILARIMQHNMIQHACTWIVVHSYGKTVNTRTQYTILNDDRRVAAKHTSGQAPMLINIFYNV